MSRDSSKGIHHSSFEYNQVELTGAWFHTRDSKLSVIKSARWIDSSVDWLWCNLLLATEATMQCMREMQTAIWITEWTGIANIPHPKQFASIPSITVAEVFYLPLAHLYLILIHIHLQHSANLAIRISITILSKLCQHAVKISLFTTYVLRQKWFTTSSQKCATTPQRLRPIISETKTEQISIYKNTSYVPPCSTHNSNTRGSMA